MQFVTLPERFERTEFDAVILGGETWLRGHQIGGALGFENPGKAITKIWDRNQSEFDDSTTMLVQVPTSGGRQLVRLYNARGAALIAMKAQTPKGEAFRRWVLDVLEGKADAGDDTPIQAGELTPTVLYRLRAQFIEYPKMRQLIRYRSQGLSRKEIAKLLDVTGNYVSGQLRVAEFLGLIERDPRIDAFRASPQYLAFIKGKADYHQRRKARLDGQKALPAPAAGQGAEVEHG
jgi:hypothetical protein